MFGTAVVGDEGAVLNNEGRLKDCRPRGLLGAPGIVSADPGLTGGAVLSGEGRRGDDFLRLGLLGVKICEGRGLGFVSRLVLRLCRTSLFLGAIAGEETSSRL